MANVFNLIKPQAKLPRNGFDLSQRHLFSCVAGRLYPILALDCVPGDHHEINVVDLVRSMPVHTDAFVRMKQHFEFYFVPYSQHMSNFNQFISQRDNQYSTNIGNNNNGAVYISLKDILATISNVSHEVDVMNHPIVDQSLQLLDLLGYGSHYNSYDNPTYRECYRDYKVNVFRLAAYQKIWYDYYRNSYYDNLSSFMNSETPYVESFNFDDAIGVLDIATARNDDSMRLAEMLMPRYRQWKKDMFTGLLPDATFGAVSYVSIAPPAQWQYPLPVEGQNIDVYAIVKANALQKWRENVMRAGSMTSDAMRAHYGLEPKFDSDNKAQFVGAFDSFISIDEVVSTATNSLGEIGGKGVGSANGRIRFDCSDFGTLMCVYSILPEAEYNSVGIDKANTACENFDFFTPEFENLGFEPVQAYQLSGYTSPALGPAGAVHLLDVIGYAPRYYQYKTAVDKVHDNFLSELSPNGLYEPGYLAHWASTRRDFSFQTQDGVHVVTLASLYVNPKVLDSIFQLQVEGRNILDASQFIVNASFDIKSIRNMSVLGLPQF